MFYTNLRKANPKVNDELIIISCCKKCNFQQLDRCKDLLFIGNLLFKCINKTVKNPPAIVENDILITSLTLVMVDQIYF